jgi:hypothetical protein
MRKSTIVLTLLALLTASTVCAISPGDDLLIAGAARTNRWLADLYINNPGTLTVTVEVMWINRDIQTANPDPAIYTVGPGETLILEDVLNSVFGFNRAEGAFRITATGGEVTANLIVFTGAGSENGTYGSGFEAIPASAATSAGEFTNIMGMVLDSAFYTNLFALAGANGVTMDIDLLDPDGGVLDTERVVLDAYQPWFASVENLWSVSEFANGTAQARVSAGSMVMLGSKVDRASKDPTTLEQEFGSGGGGSVDGTYQFAIYDSLLFASGGNLVISDGEVTGIVGTYVNYDKGVIDPDTSLEIPGGVSECDWIFQWGLFFPITAVEDFESGVEHTDSYEDDPSTPEDDSGDMTWTVTFTIDDNLGFSGTIEAVGSNFDPAFDGCNGEFPSLDLEGGKSN